MIYLPNTPQSYTIETSQLKTFLNAGRYEIDLFRRKTRFRSVGDYSVYQGAPVYKDTFPLPITTESDSPSVKSSFEHCLRLLDEHNFHVLYSRVTYAYRQARATNLEVLTNPIVLVGSYVQPHIHFHDDRIVTYAFSLKSPNGRLVVTDGGITTSSIGDSVIHLRGNQDHSTVSSEPFLFVVFDRVVVD